MADEGRCDVVWDVRDDGISHRVGIGTDASNEFLDILLQDIPLDQPYVGVGV